MKMHLLRIVTAATIALLLSPASASAQKVSYDFDKTEDFTLFKTFGFKEGTSTGNKLVDDRIVAALTTALTSKGLKRNDTNPDIWVVTHITFDEKREISTFSTGAAYGPYGWGWGGGWGGTDVRVYDIVEGTLIIDIADSKQNQLAWRGIGVKEINPQQKPDKLDKNVVNSVNKILKNFPPPKKKK
jgi:hypothetical protein